jgi:hypothetical protein
MANQVTKIYEVKTLGYDTLIEQLNNIDIKFASIKRTKQELNALKFSTEDAAKIDELNRKLAEEIVKSKELKLEKQRLMNEKKALTAANDQEAASSKKVVAQVVAETGSLTNLIAKRKELKNLLSAVNPANNPTIPFNGQNLSFDQATNKAKDMDKQISILRQNMSGMESIGNRVNTSLAAGFERMRGSLGQMILTYTGWFAAFQTAGKLISENIRLSDSFADLQIRIKGTSEDVDDLFENLKGLDTRTSLAGLVDIANIVAKKGVPREEIAGLTAEFDKLNIVLGSEIGDPSTATANIIKLITIFNDDKHVTAERVAEIGTSLFKLTTSGVATGEFLVNFAERVGAVRGITGLTLPNILGMGAALQQLGQRTEVAGTAAVQLTTRIFADIPKFAKAAGVSIQEFRDLLDQNPFEALIQVAEGLKEISSDKLAANFEEVVTAFGEVGVTGVRIKAVLGDIATNGAFVRERMKQAAVATTDYANQTAAAELKQNTFAAVLDRVRKALEEIALNKVVQATLLGVGTAILTLVQAIPILLTLLGLLGVSWIAQNTALIATRISLVLYNLQIGINSVAIVILNIAYGAHLILIGLVRGAYILATRAAALFGITIKATPLGILAITLTGILTLLSSFGDRVSEASDALERQNAAMRISREIIDTATKATEKQRTQVQVLVEATKDLTIGEGTRVDILQRLIAIDPVFQQTLIDGKINYDKLATAVNLYNNALQQNAEQEAAQTIALREREKLNQLVTDRRDVETAIATKNFKSLSEDIQREIQAIALAGTKSQFGTLNEGDFIAAARQVAARIKNETKTQVDIVVAAQKAFNQKINETSLTKPKDTVVGILADEVDVDIPRLKQAIKDLDNQIDIFVGSDEKLRELVENREKLKEQLKKATDIDKPTKNPIFRGSRLSGEDKDELAIIEANMKQELAIEETRYAALQLNHKASFQEEIDYAANVRDIQQKYIAQKIAYLESLDKLNAKELLSLSTFKKEFIDSELNFQNKRQAINDRNFDLQRRNLKTILDGQIANINLEVERIEQDATTTNEARARARAEGDEKILDLIVAYHHQIDLLEKRLNQDSTENAREGAANIARAQQAILDNSIKILNARLGDAANAGESIVNEFRIRAAERTKKVLEDPTLSPLQIARELKAIQDQLSIDLLAAQEAQLRIELALYKQGKDSKIKNEREYQAKLRELKEIEVKLTAETINKELTQFERFFKALKNFVKDAAENIFGIKKFTNDDKGKAEKEKEALEDTAASIKDAMQKAEEGFFQRREDRIERERNIAKERLDIEDKQRKARAQSEAEILSIEAQSAEKRKAIDRKAAEEKKKLALKELTIDYAKAVLKSLAQYGLPLALLPIAGATALYLIQRGNVNAQQFKKGGIPKKNGGPIIGAPHSQGGVKFVMEAEDAEAYIINKDSMRKQGIHTVTGTNAQIASAINRIGGGVDFRPGARVIRQFETGGFLGTSYPAPNYKPTNTSTDTEALRLEFKAYADKVDKWVNELQVVQDPNSVAESQRKIVKQNNIGTLK